MLRVSRASFDPNFFLDLTITVLAATKTGKKNKKIRIGTVIVNVATK